MSHRSHPGVVGEGFAGCQPVPCPQLAFCSVIISPLNNFDLSVFKVLKVDGLICNFFLMNRGVEMFSLWVRIGLLGNIQGSY